MTEWPKYPQGLKTDRQLVSLPSVCQLSQISISLVPKSELNVRVFIGVFFVVVCFLGFFFFAFFLFVLFLFK